MCLRVTFIAEMDRVIIAGRGLGWPWAPIADKVGISVPLVRHRGVEVLGLDPELPHKSRQVARLRKSMRERWQVPEYRSRMVSTLRLRNQRRARTRELQVS